MADILFAEIFERAITMIDDPDLRLEHSQDPVQFQIDMRKFLMLGKNKFISPTAITDKLIEFSSPQGKLETISGTGASTYTLSTTPVDGSAFTYRIGDDIVSGGTYDPASNAVTFPSAVAVGSVCSVAWYFAGAFTADFSDCFRSDFPISPIMDKIETILAYCIASAWGDQEQDRALDERNIVTDTDYKVASNANSARAHVEWNEKILRDMNMLVSELNWRIKSTPSGGSRFGK